MIFFLTCTLALTRTLKISLIRTLTLTPPAPINAYSPPPPYSPHSLFFGGHDLLHCPLPLLRVILLHHLPLVVLVVVVLLLVFDRVGFGGQVVQLGLEAV